MSEYVCPVCDYPELEQDPHSLSYEICIQCGVEFGCELEEDYPAIRERWIAAGRKMWADPSKPDERPDGPAPWLLDPGDPMPEMTDEQP